jgi:hypothetical protein
MTSSGASRQPQPFCTPAIESKLATLLPLPFGRGEGRGEGSVRWLGFMVPMQGKKAVEAFHEPQPEFPLTPTPLPKERGTSPAAFAEWFMVPFHARSRKGAPHESPVKDGPLTPSLSPSDGERVAAGRVRGNGAYESSGVALVMDGYFN